MLILVIKNSFCRFSRVMTNIITRYKHYVNIRFDKFCFAAHNFWSSCMIGIKVHCRRIGGIGASVSHLLLLNLKKSYGFAFIRHSDLCKNNLCGNSNRRQKNHMTR